MKLGEREQVEIRDKACRLENTKRHKDLLKSRD